MRKQSVPTPPPLPIELEPGGRPLAAAGILSLLYIILCAGYILFSGEIAASFSTSVLQLKRIELAKGIVFVIATGLLFFVASYLLLKRIAAQQVRILRQERALMSAERRAIAGIFASSIAHDMGNLLTAVRINIHLLKPQLDRARDTQPSLHLAQTVDELSELVQRLANLGRQGKVGEGHTSIDLGALVQRVTAFAPSHTTIRECRLSATVTGSCVVSGDESLVSRMLVNLILNAAEAAGKGGTIEIRLRRDDGMVRLEVHDSGPGVPEDMRGKIFEPFYTSKPNGTGLGLLSVKMCAVEHHGAVTVSDSALGGACFALSLPAAEPAD